jgi:hypothetical protein
VALIGHQCATRDSVIKLEWQETTAPVSQLTTNKLSPNKLSPNKLSPQRSTPDNTSPKLPKGHPGPKDRVVTSARQKTLPTTAAHSTGGARRAASLDTPVKPHLSPSPLRTQDGKPSRSYTASTIPRKPPTNLFAKSTDQKSEGPSTAVRESTSPLVRIQFEVPPRVLEIVSVSETERVVVDTVRDRIVISKRFAARSGSDRQVSGLCPCHDNGTAQLRNIAVCRVCR